MARCFFAQLIILLLAASFILPPLYADETLNDEVLVDEEQTLPLKHFFSDDPVLAGTELIVSGKNFSNQQQRLIFRLDNASSNNYRSRVNQEYSIPSGDFTLTIPMTGLRTSGGQTLKQPYSQLILFTIDGKSELQLKDVRITAPEALPDNTLALDFGHKDSPVFPGFQSVLDSDPQLTGKMLTRFRKSGDALIRDGIEGIDSINIPWPNGQWKLSLWAQEQGEWEYIPHYLSRKIFVENNKLIDQKWTVQEWIKEVYLAGTRKEADIDGDLWQLVGERRSGLIQKKIQISDGSLTVNLKGDRSARFLAALVIEPVNGTFAAQTQDQRKERFINQWPVSAPDYSLPKILTLEDISTQVKDDKFGSYLVAKGTLLNLVFEINSPEDDIKPVLAVTPLRSDKGEELSAKTRYGHWRYERPHPNAPSLDLTDSYLRADMETLNLSNQRPRRIHIQVDIPVGAQTGNYKGTLQLYSNDKLILKEFLVRVLPVTLPRLDLPVGLYLEPAPYYLWFNALKKQKPLATACDLSLLATYGFTTLAPYLIAPDTEDNQRLFINQLKQLKRFGFDKKILAYQSFRSLILMGDTQSTGLSLFKLNAMMEDEDLPEVYWSIFDEPTPEKFPSIAESATLLHNPNISFKTAGHLNNPRQQQLSSTADLLIMNHGYGVNDRNIKLLKKVSNVWLYNMPKPRLAAGAFLWNSEAEGYIQWHGRMPTADPFDPTDGREGDVSYIYPWQGGCPDTISIHSRLLELHEATLDYRWLQWLEQKSQSNKNAKRLLKQLRKELPTDWKEAESMTTQEALEIRRKIINLLD
ncbi:hypothetical protein ACH42_04825 [Endozoicomonas sp. (ex Bugula neritina AB1)]|nr:hypothetical protein ACH42_04825 [Endozoicomonas sp. (ex Bugula neritina AB1)]